MTRINCIDPELLNDKHLIAEYRELPRIFALIRKAQERNDTAVTPDYKLGTGHVRFFYDKAYWLVKRQSELIKECKARGFNIKYDNPQSLLEGIHSNRCKDWVPSNKDKELNINRINERGGLRT